MPNRAGALHNMERASTRRKMSNLATINPINAPDDTVPPVQLDEFEDYIARCGYCKIQNVSVMEQFLIRAAKHFHKLNQEYQSALAADTEFPRQRMNVWGFLHEQFSTEYADLRIFFSETDDYYNQSPEERKRLHCVADALLRSAKDVQNIQRAESYGGRN